MSFEAYSVAIRLKLIDGVSTGIIGLSQHFFTLNRHITSAQEGVSALQKQLHSLKMQGLVGGALLGLGVGGLDLLNAPLKAAREYELAFTKFKTLNLGDVVNKQADQFARSASLMGVSAKDLMQTMSESVGILGSFSEAAKIAPAIASLNAANSAIFAGKIGSIDEGGTRALLKFIDRRGGGRDTESLRHNLDLAEKLVTGSGGFVQFRDLASFSQQGGVAFRGLSDQGILNMALLLQEQGGARAGTAMMSIYQNLIAGRTPVKTMHMLEAMGLGTMAEQYNGSVGGRRSHSMVLKNIKDADLLQSDPATWFRTVFLGQLAKHGITDEAGILKSTNDLLSNRTAAGQASIMTTQLLQLARDSSLAKNAMGYEQVTAAYAKDPNARWGDLQKKYFNLMLELGEAALPFVTRAVTGLTEVVKDLTKFARDFPGTTKTLIGAFTALAALAAAGGAITLITAGFRGLGLVLTAGGGLAAQLTAVSGGLGMFASRLGKLGVLAGVGAASYEATRFVADTGIPWVMSKVGANDSARRYQNWTFGGWLHDAFNGGGYQNVSPTVHPRSAGSQGTVGAVYLDKRKVGSVLFQEQNKSLMAPQTGSNWFDNLMAPMPAGGVQ